MLSQISDKIPNDKIKFKKDEKNILIKGARVHNLKNVDLEIGRNKLVVITGVSGSGKSSLAIDTLFAEGQRRYVESLSAYARQFLVRMNKPDVDYIKGLCPAIAIEQKVSTRSSRSTVGSLTEIYDYLRLLYARIGKTYSPVSGKEVQKHEVSDVVDFIKSLKEGATVFILSPQRTPADDTPLKLKKAKTEASVTPARTLKQELNILNQKGFARIISEKEVYKIEELLADEAQLKTLKGKSFQLVVDRIVWKKDDEDLQSRISDSVGVAFFEGHGDCIIFYDGKEKKFSNKFELDGILFEEPTPHLFSFNNPYGACRRCEGFGSVIGVDENLVIPDKNKSVYEGAIAPWKGEKMGEWLTLLIKSAHKFDFPVHRSIRELTAAEKKLLWTGNKYFHGLDEFFKELEKQSYKIQYRVMLSRYRGKTTCPDCGGARVRIESSYVKIGGKSIGDLVIMPVKVLQQFFLSLTLSPYEKEISKRLLLEINNRLEFMMEVGLGYLTLNRISSTLSGGETQRINLTRTLGSNLTSSLYILDEPSVGLHPKDTGQLVKVLHKLRDLGNTVLVVEHEEEIMNHADQIIDMGPLAGALGGEVVFSGTFKEILKDKNSLTGKYLTGVEKITVPTIRRNWTKKIEFLGCVQNNLQNIDVTIPLNVMVVVTGVSGSGKTTLVKQIAFPALSRALGNFGDKPGEFSEMKAVDSGLSQIEMVDQNPIGKSSRSNPVTYIKAYDLIRDLYAKQRGSQLKGFQPKHFSFNVDGGRCDNCKGEGEIVVEMQFLSDVHLLCEVCKGKRFKDEVLEVNYKDKNIADILDLTVDEAIEFFIEEKNLHEAILPLAQVGLGYVKLGQSSSTLSGGEAQRVKLASFLGKGSSQNPVLFIFDEPTTGLHFHDISKLLQSFNALIEQGHSVLIIEHNMEVIKCADYIIDLGPDGGDEGGQLLFQGTPEDMIANCNSHTANYLRGKLN
ncbi:MAG: excinuclease ABC subunit A [Sphingobacteriales bacterium]|nr:MAG: excinuclease ABC subunit A [Sphingobacteriales bacterium]